MCISETCRWTRAYAAAAAAYRIMVMEQLDTKCGEEIDHDQDDDEDAQHRTQSFVKTSSQRVQGRRDQISEGVNESISGARGVAVR